MGEVVGKFDDPTSAPTDTGHKIEKEATEVGVEFFLHSWTRLRKNSEQHKEQCRAQSGGQFFKLGLGRLKNEN
jgi:hypothetical protein